MVCGWRRRHDSLVWSIGGGGGGGAGKHPAAAVERHPVNPTNTNQPTIQPTNQPIIQPTYQPTNQPTHDQPNQLSSHHHPTNIKLSTKRHSTSNYPPSYILSINTKLSSCFNYYLANIQPSVIAQPSNIEHS